MNKILIIFTGGTIASCKTENGLEPILNGNQLLSYLPQLGEDICIDVNQLMSIDSTDMDKEGWLKIVSVIQEKYNQYDGFVICHGTDTMAYTSAILSYLIKNSHKPICITGSQLPIYMEDTDGIRNLMDSIRYASDREASGVVLIFNGRVISGTRAKKIRSHSFDGFESVNFPEIARINQNGIIEYIKKTVFKEQVSFHNKVYGKVFVLKLVPGMDSAILPSIFKEFDAIIVESFGVGGMPKSMVDEFCRLVDYYREKNILKVVVMATQVIYEGTNIETYQVGKRILDKINVLQAWDMTTEAAIGKLMWILSIEKSSFKKISQMFYTPINYDILITTEL